MENIDLEESKNIAFNNSTNERFNGATQFTIPALKAPKLLGGGSQGLSKQPTSNINKFLLKQLKDEQNPIGQQTTTTNRFNVPQLQCTTSFKIPELKIGKLTKIADTATNDLTNIRKTVLTANILESQSSLNSLQLHTLKKQQETTEDNIIDLTAALSTTRIGKEKSIRENQKNKEKTEQFDIPFIDCDRALPPTNEYCGIDISHAKYKHNLVSPSALGKILSSKNNRLKRNRRGDTETEKSQPKHHIERFLFDTQSPDDMVLAALNRFTRP